MSIRDDLQNIYDQYATAYQVKDAAGCAAVFSQDSEVFSPYARLRREAARRSRCSTENGRSLTAKTSNYRSLTQAIPAISRGV